LNKFLKWLQKAKNPLDRGGASDGAWRPALWPAEELMIARHTRHLMRH
jgi:hypothetical protein